MLVEEWVQEIVIDKYLDTMICDAQNILLEVKYISFLYILGTCMQEQLVFVLLLQVVLI